MTNDKNALKELQNELHDFKDRHPALSPDELFLSWFLRAYVTEDEQQAVSSLSGCSRDKGIDALFVDESSKLVYIIQGKYRQSVSVKNESRNAILSFVSLAQDVMSDYLYKELVNKMDEGVRSRLDIAHDRLLKRDYKLRLYYVTLGKCSSALAEEAEKRIAPLSSVSFELFDGKRILNIYRDYLDGVAPPVPSLNLDIEQGGVLNRYDNQTGIESWVFTISGPSVANLFDRTGHRLFARNVRGFLGSTDINRNMENTLRKEPDYFWYYNNGITIVCDKTRKVTHQGKEILKVENPQVINGQQTTRMLHRFASRKSRSNVLVRVICIPRDSDDYVEGFESLVTRIVAATNWQNAIRASDLMSNDRRQIEIERRFRKLNYYYLRKRQTKGEAKKNAGAHRFIVKKDELAQAVAACEFDPSIVREGKENLFEERHYRNVFPTGNPEFYLSRYWLTRLVTFYARGYPERAYAKWLAINFMWNNTSQYLRNRSAMVQFREECERNVQNIDSLGKAADLLFNSIIRFYNLKKGKGATRLDISTFFQRRGLHKEFDKFWRGSKNRYRKRYRRLIKQFAVQLREEY